MLVIGTVYAGNHNVPTTSDPDTNTSLVVNKPSVTIQNHDTPNGQDYGYVSTNPFVNASSALAIAPGSTLRLQIDEDNTTLYFWSSRRTGDFPVNLVVARYVDPVE